MEMSKGDAARAVDSRAPLLVHPVRLQCEGTIQSVLSV